MSLPSCFDSKLFLQQVAKFLRLPSGDMYRTARGIQAWICAQQGPITCVHCEKTMCTYCHHRLLHKTDPVPNNQDVFFTAAQLKSSKNKNEHDVDESAETGQLTESLTVEEMYVSGIFCDACMEWQARSNWQLDSFENFLEEHDEDAGDCSCGGGPGWKEYGVFFTKVLALWDGDCKVCSHNDQRWFCVVCVKRRDAYVIRVEDMDRSRFCQHGTCSCLESVKNTATRNNTKENNEI